MQLTRKKGVDLQLTRKQGKGKNSQLMYHLMMLPGMLFLLVFSFVPMLGIVMAFQNYIPAKGILGSTWVGLANFKYMLEIPDSLQILMNTVIIASWKIVLGTIVPVVFALLLNEIRIKWAKRTIQTIVYLPNFLSWVVLAAVVVNLFDYHGPVNTFLATFGVKPILFMAATTGSGKLSLARMYGKASVMAPLSI